MSIKSSQFIRDAARVHKAWEKTSEGSMVALKPLKVYIPARFPQRELALFEDEITFVGICAVVLEDKYYMASRICAPIRSEPTLVNNVVIDDVEYIEMQYEPGDRVICSEDLVMIDNLLYRIYDEIIAKGRVPWYVSYRELGGIFATSLKHAGVRVGKTPTVMEIIASAICRDSEDLRRYYRQTVETYEDITANPPTIIPLRNVSYGATNTIAKLTGSRFDEGMTAAIVNPGERVERTERVLRT
ncbi:hypothetical protein PA10_00096 [Pseudomonas phage pPa_SNUABM_DT01]|nr:hypothetical protein PA10_00096 [Pseudomonas phage pPa_SNUABM_DT01]